jgi:hypothetical protein
MRVTEKVILIDYSEHMIPFFFAQKAFGFSYLHKISIVGRHIQPVKYMLYKFW